jgi:hypothetical protein
MPSVTHFSKTCFRVRDTEGVFEFDAQEASDTEIISGLMNLIDHSDPEFRSEDASSRYAVFALLTNYFQLERTLGGRGERLTNTLFDGIYEY